MTIKDLKDRRSALWAELDKIITQETAIRTEIKAIQSELFVLEALPQIAVLESRISAGEFQGDALTEKQQKLQLLKAHVDALKGLKVG